jgi:hypothetical protein
LIFNKFRSSNTYDLQRDADASGTGRYNVGRLIERRGPDGKVVDLLAAITADCPRKAAGYFSDRCGAKCPLAGKIKKDYSVAVVAVIDTSDGSSHPT